MFVGGGGAVVKRGVVVVREVIRGRGKVVRGEIVFRGGVVDRGRGMVVREGRMVVEEEEWR